jgi:GTPase involved in cell partitioning and DNA repair
MNIQETQKIRSIVDNYKSIHQELNSYEKSLENMTKGVEEKTEDKISYMGVKIKECISKLEQERKTEKEFFLLIQEKYGPGEFDIETFEYKIKD